ncbi:CopG family transcriptional regulator [Mycobacterium sp.]|uniref:CopG family transcriptional regulator n=1 Tax=Mycobacterium sp. TaxID=1785 RepID=UPI002BD73D9A|nr:CopG family transcriptional regulator [Mycobacterium sp.]HTY30143.1 CopG family transcriptional regulator [Mycobacterium sp.]
MEITLSISDQQAEALRRQAAAEGLSMQAVASSAIDEYLARQADEAKAAALEAFVVGLGNPR